MATDGLLKPTTDPHNKIANYFKGWEIFEFRLEHEHKLAEYREELKRLCKDEGMNKLQAKKAAQKKFGYTSLKEEREKYVEWLKSPQDERKREATNERARRAHTKQRNLPFEKALSDLPPSANASDEMNWIKSHPAMSRKDRSRNATDRVLVTPDDIASSPNGPCPSRAAAQQLQHWVNRPEQFYKDVLSETKKAKARNDEAEEKERTSKTNKEINSMLDMLFTEPEEAATE